MSNANSFSSDVRRQAPAKAIAAVLFDRDGVLTYFDVEAAVAFFRPLLPISLAEIARRWQGLGAGIGFPRNLAEERLFWSNFWEQLGDEFALTAAQRAALGELDYTRFVVPYPEVRSVLAQLRAQNIQLGVLSNFSLASLEQSLVTAGLAEYFDIACSAPVLGVAKPDARAYKIALEALQVPPGQCLFFDDEAICVEGARRVGLHAYLVDRQAPADALNHGVVANLQSIQMLIT